MDRRAPRSSWCCWRCAAVIAIARDQSGPRTSSASLDDPRDRREARADILDTPVHPGSIVKTVALVAALERGVITADSSHMCRRRRRPPTAGRSPARIPI